MTTFSHIFAEEPGAIRWRRGVLIAALAAAGLTIGAVDGAVLLSLSMADRPSISMLALASLPMVLAALSLAGAISVANGTRLLGLFGRGADFPPVIEFMTDQTGSRLGSNMRADTLLRGTSRPIEHLWRLIDERDEVSRQDLSRLSLSARSGTADQGELRVRLDNKETAMLLVQVTPLKKRHPAALWRIAEITAKRASTPIEAGSKQRAAIAAPFDRLPVGLFSTDGTGRFVWANDTFAAWLGLTRESLVSDNRRVQEFLEPLNPTHHGDAAFLDPVTDAAFTMIDVDGRRSIYLLSQSVDQTEEGGIRTAAVLRQKTDQNPTSNRDEPLEHFELFFDIAPIGIAFLDNDRCFTQTNPALNALFEDVDGPLTGKRLVDFVSDADRDSLETRLDQVFSGELIKQPLEVRLKGTREKTVALFASRLERGSRETGALILHFIDLTEQKSLELQFSQSQKMQAIGQLAGGVAHDFNNLLTAMIGFCDLLLLRFRPGDQSFADIMQIKQNANRAANLVRQLLAFSRRQTLQPRVIDVTEVLSELRHLLNRLLGEGIELELSHQRDLGPVKVDPGQLEQVIINLAVNARDAMPNGGTLSIKTQNVELTQPLRQEAEVVPPGAYVQIGVGDTGTGIPPHILGRIFEPFFSTKEVGSGTGLGLSTVYGIVKQTGGFIFVESTIGLGTSFSIYLPRFQEVVTGAVPRLSAPEPTRDLTGAGTVLLVEDEAPVRMFSSRALRNKGYTVLEAKSGEHALEVLAENQDAIDLIITDVVMPRMDGPTLIRHVREKMPHVKVIFISGYTEDTLARRIADTEDVSFLPKPFSLAQLAERVKEVIANPL